MGRLTEIVERVRPAVVGFIPRVLNGKPVGLSLADAPPPIFGTGFIVSPDGLVVTNAHVAKQFEVVAGASALPSHLMVLALLMVPRADKIGCSLIPVSGVAYATAVEEPSGKQVIPPDIALLRLFARELPFVDVADEAAPLRVGDDIAVLGYTGGNKFLTCRGHRLHSPLLQRGVVSGLTHLIPGIAGMFYTDVMVQPGVSGSPVLGVDTGKVVGVVAGRLREKDPSTGECQPTSMCYCYSSKWIGMLRRSAEKLVPPRNNAPIACGDRVPGPNELNAIFDAFFQAEVKRENEGSE